MQMPVPSSASSSEVSEIQLHNLSETDFMMPESLSEVAEVLKATEDLQKCWSSTLSLRCFYSMNTSSQKLDQVITLLNKLYVVVSPVSSIPCRYLATADEDGWDCILNAIIV